MSISTERFTRKTFTVEAVRVTSENIYELAAQVKGEVRDSGTLARVDETQLGKLYIDLVVWRHGRDQRAMAFLGDWITISPSNNLEVYAHKRFKSTFALEYASKQAAKRAALLEILTEYGSFSVSSSLGFEDGPIELARNEAADKIENLFR
jgi:hypothetical protein